jgi:hypothetical protein
MNEEFMNLVSGIIYNKVEKETKSIVFQDLFIVAYGNEITEAEAEAEAAIFSKIRRERMRYIIEVE